MSAALDRFFDHYYRRRPINATFTGIHDFDTRLPDWSRKGLEDLDAEMRALHADLSAAYPVPESPNRYNDDVDLVDGELARGFLEIQLAENDSGHGMRGNPALWTGEAIFGVVSLMIREFTSMDDRIQCATARLAAIPEFLGQARETLVHALPNAWADRALRDGEGAVQLLTRGVDAWLASGHYAPERAMALRTAAAAALEAFDQFGEWIRKRPDASDDDAACGPAMYDLLLSRGHYCVQSRAELLERARADFARERDTLDVMTRDTAGNWSTAQDRLAADHPPPDDYLSAFSHIWMDCRAHADARGVVSWPHWPIRYETYPPWTRDAAPYLYYLHYRSPAPFDDYTTYRYVVPPLPATEIEKHLRVWNHSVIKLNHVVHHGGIGHHVQNWHAYHRARSRIGKIAAVDCANRIGMFCAGTMAEGWACYATELMDELDFLTPLERLSQQHSRLRFLARAIVDIEFHQGTLMFDRAVQFFIDELGMNATAARAETTKCSMFPGTAAMYWIGTQGILDLRATLQRDRGPSFTLKSFHDELLGHGSIPIPLIARMMTASVV